ncbi:MAG: DUF4012 domain-containing protein [Patescibacteria group bacterium]|jgi:hypothetical protein
MRGSIRKKSANKHVDFLKPGKKKTQRRIRWQLLGVIGAAVILLCALGFAGYVRAKNIEQRAREGERYFKDAQIEALAFDFVAAKDSTDAAVALFTEAHDDMGPFRLFTFVPFLGTQVSAADNLLLLAQETGIAIREILNIADAALTTLTENTELTPDSLTNEERRQILGALDAGEESLATAEYHLSIAQKAFNDIPDSGLIGPLADISAELAEQFPLIEDVIDNALPFTRILPHIVGYPDGITYLFLLQNNQELRPTGGFIGTYGILDIASGQVNEFSTDNVYNLDEAAQPRVTREAPEPLQAYLAADKWFFRDVNWSPDFPTTAQDALALYAEEDLNAPDIDGVIAITPVLLKDLLGITGPITVDGVEFTEENALEELRFQVDKGFVARGEVGNERKGIIGSLGQELVTKLENLPQAEWPGLWSVFIKNIEERHILLYVKDPKVQAVLHDRTWDGSLRATANDYLHIVDANLASLKTDSVMERNIVHNVDLDSGEATVSMTYHHTGEFTSLISRYRTYVRTYVPFGSELLESSGFATNDKLHNGQPTEATTGAAHGYTVFSGFVSIEPGESITTTLRYALPDELVRRMRKDGYELTVQKQAGLERTTLTSTIKLGKTIAHATPSNAVESKENDTVTFSTAFDEDQFFRTQ